ncbi:MAG: DUF429 domain-containing protein [Bryobacterales bacterium]|nr:DUF429 domain-containing protein [Bryobacterales bacterium]
MRIAAVDWSVDRKKRWVCECVDGVVHAPRMVVDAEAAVWKDSPAQRAGSTRGTRGLAHGGRPGPCGLLTGEGPAVVGFDFPIGMPEAYCRAAGMRGFAEALEREWVVTDSPSMGEPFYPRSPGGRSMAVLEKALGMERGAWLRRCDRETGAGALFWTLGAKQVGRAAISGWREVLRVRPEGWKLWPFEDVDVKRDKWVAEIYPAMGYAKNFGKRYLENRRAFGGELRDRAKRLGVRLDEELEEMVEEGFAEGEDAFDAFAGVLVMVEGLEKGAPEVVGVRRWEGWILGAAFR